MKAKELVFLVITGEFKLLNSVIQNKITNNTMLFLDVFFRYLFGLVKQTQSAMTFDLQVSQIIIHILD